MTRGKEHDDREELLKNASITSALQAKMRIKNGLNNVQTCRGMSHIQEHKSESQTRNLAGTINNQRRHSPKDHALSISAFLTAHP